MRKCQPWFRIAVVVVCFRRRVIRMQFVSRLYRVGVASWWCVLQGKINATFIILFLLSVSSFGGRGSTILWVGKKERSVISLPYTGSIHHASLESVSSWTVAVESHVVDHRCFLHDAVLIAHLFCKATTRKIHRLMQELKTSKTMLTPWFSRQPSIPSIDGTMHQK